MSKVLITGCSSGIGAALAQAFHRRGVHVIATARRLESLAALKEQGIQLESLDVNDAEHVERLSQAVLEQHGLIDILINNAGFGLFGPSIELELDDLRLQMETNLLAPLRLAQAFAPAMKAARTGKIVNIGSISGIASTPFSGAYCASKAALHALSDSLRMELAPLGIQVITVQPGAIASSFGETAAQTAAKVLKADSWYSAIEAQILKRAELSQQGATPAEKFANELVSLILKPDAPSVIRKGKKSFYLPTVKRLLPTAVLDGIMRKKFGLNQKL